MYKIKKICFFLFCILSLNIFANDNFDTLLSLAIKGDKQSLENKISQGHNIDIVDNLGRSLVLRVTMKKNLQALKLLIKLGAKIDYYDKSLSKNVIDQTAFLYAGAKGMNEFLNVLIKENAKTDILNYYGGTALIPACEKGYVSTVKLLLEKTKININHINYLGWTALLETVILSNGGKNHQKIVALLLEYGANKEIKDKNGFNALDHAKKESFSAIVKLLE
ncbi:MAG: hypothetical protein COA66_08980 [Arcobacter sp.]|nr:MAG: hypothetical protein COA66_08980 [Arcobacter sp.]